MKQSRTVALRMSSSRTVKNKFVKDGLAHGGMGAGIGIPTPGASEIAQLLDTLLEGYS